ncbi:MAG: transcriptional repressor [Actinomycetota bacterium]
MAVDPLHEDVSTMLRSDDHRYTIGRRRVIEVLRNSGGPITIPEILSAGPDLAQSSVYRNLAILESVGAVTRIVTHDDHARFELAEKLTNHHHHHLICTSCGSVDDFELSNETESTITSDLGRVAQLANFRVDGHRLDLLGTCTACA